MKTAQMVETSRASVWFTTPLFLAMEAGDASNGDGSVILGPRVRRHE